MRNKKYIGIIICVVICIAGLCILKNESSKNVVTTNAGTLSNQKIGWGLKRAENHQQPDLGTKNKQLIDNYDGIAVGNKEKPYVYLTFDEGYEAGYTESILNILKEKEVKATFFITAHYLNTEPELVQRMIEEGHIVGNHTVNHKSMPDLSEEEIKKEVMDLHTAIYNKFGYEMKYIRPPKGEFSERTLDVTNNLGYKTVMWSLAYDDWDENKQGREEYAKSKILDNVHNGAVILLHGNSKDNANVLGECIIKIKEQGYEFRGLDMFER